MRNWTWALSIVLLLSADCSKKGDGIVVVTVTAAPDLTNVASLHGRATAGAKTVMFDFNIPAPNTIPPAQTFGIDVPTSLSGVVAVHIDARDSSGAVLASGDGSTTLSAGKRVDISISLGGGGFDMAGAGGLSIDHNAQSFGTVSVGQQSAAAKFVVSNGGSVATGVPTLSVSGANLNEFQITTDCTAALMPGDQCNVNAIFAPTSAGNNKVAAFQITASPGGSVTAALSGMAVPPGALMMAPTMGNCGSSTVGIASPMTAMFTITNTGGTASGVPMVMTSDTQFVASGCSAALNPSAMCNVTVTFTPTSTGTKIASLSVSASPGGTATASLTGIGLSAATLSISPSTYTFAGETKKGMQGALQDFVVTNNGQSISAALTAATITTGQSTSFTVDTDGCVGMALAANASCTVKVRFAPQQAGLSTTNLNVGPTTATVSGRGLGAFVREVTRRPGFYYNAVWGSGPNDVYVGGYNNEFTHSTGNGTWTAQTLTGATSSGTGVSSIHGASASNVYVVNGNGELFHSSGNGTWSKDGGVGTNCANSIFVNALSDVYCAGSGTQNYIGHWIGGSVTVNLQPSGGPLVRMRGTSPTNLFVVAFGGAIYQSAGGANPSWAAQGSGTGSDLHGVFGLGIGDVWAVGDGPTILHQTVAGSWSPVTQTATTSFLRDVFEASAQELFIVGGGVVIHTIDSGANWETLTLPVAVGQLLQVWGSSDHDVYTVGEDGALLHYY